MEKEIQASEETNVNDVESMRDHSGTGNWTGKIGQGAPDKSRKVPNITQLKIASNSRLDDKILAAKKDGTFEKDKKEEHDENVCLKHRNPNVGTTKLSKSFFEGEVPDKERPGYEPIEHHGVIGNMRTTALVSSSASIDFWCYPYFDSPAVFCALLDKQKGGHFSVFPVDAQTHKPSHWNEKQCYWPDTNILKTRFLLQEGVGEVVDYMPIPTDRFRPQTNCIIRRVTVVRGRVCFRVQCYPAFDFARAQHTTTYKDPTNKKSIIFASKDLELELVSSMQLDIRENGISTVFCLKEGERAVFILHRKFDPSSKLLKDENEEEKERLARQITVEKEDKLLNATITFWRKWLGKCTYKGRWRETVHRSALILKLLTFENTGAVIAAATTSLPEKIGGSRNWDYRYMWMRDSAFTIYGLLRIGLTEEASRFVQCLTERCNEAKYDEDPTKSPLQIVYGIDGRRNMPESELDHLEGYMGSGPVRVGNAAADQLQLDIYGELLDSIYIYNKHQPISYDLWTHLRKLVNWVADNWNQPDDGIWEVRGGRSHFVYSKVMCWVCVDRGLRLADRRSFPADRRKWYLVRDEIYEDIMAKGWNKELEAFTQSYGSTTLDASNLIMPLVFFMAPNDPRMQKTLDKILKPPEEGGLTSASLVMRYPPQKEIHNGKKEGQPYDPQKTEDGFDGEEEGTFNMCTFWLIEALTRAGKTDAEKMGQARVMFEEILSYSNHLGIFAEETGPHGEMLGNFPQAFTHLALISAAFNLDRSLAGS